MMRFVHLLLPIVVLCTLFAGCVTEPATEEPVVYGFVDKPPKKVKTNGKRPQPVVTETQTLPL